MTEPSHHLSILIPTYNDICVDLVEELRFQCDSVKELAFEIIVADDGSTRQDTVSANEVINTMDCCRYIVREVNTGRAAIRNFLAREAQYDTLLFIDSHMSVISSDFIVRYLNVKAASPFICGGYTIPASVPKQKANLRYRYEMRGLHAQSAEERGKNPYAHFHTSNFLISREIMLSHPFDERFRHYGYEDVFFGKSMLQASVPIMHIDNPVGFCRFESNKRFVRKTEEAMQTLNEFEEELTGYSRLLRLKRKCSHQPVKGMLRLVYRLFGKSMRNRLTGSHPSLFVFNLYRLLLCFNYAKKS